MTMTTQRRQTILSLVLAGLANFAADLKDEKKAKAWLAEKLQISCDTATEEILTWRKLPILKKYQEFMTEYLGMFSAVNKDVSHSLTSGVANTLFKTWLVEKEQSIDDRHRNEFVYQLRENAQVEAYQASNDELMDVCASFVGGPAANELIKLLGSMLKGKPPVNYDFHPFGDGSLDGDDFMDKFKQG